MIPTLQGQTAQAVFNAAQFIAPFADAGNGLVTTTLARGVGPASFTRATSATTIGSTGLVIKGIASGSPRSRYDPTTLEYQGYFAEGARTNICLQSEDLATTWGNVRSSETTNATTSPDGTANADKLIEDASAATTHYISQAITFTNAVYTYSVWLKAGERTWANLRFTDGTTTVSCYFDLDNGVVGTASNGAGAMKAYPDGWYRCQLTATAASAAAAGDCRVVLAEGDNGIVYDGDGTSGIYVWGAQVEAGSFASSYIPTTTASVTRNADVLTYPFAGNADATQGWAYAEVSSFWTASEGTSLAVGFGSGVEWPLGWASSNASTALRARDGTNIPNKTGLTDVSTGVRKRVCSWGSAGLAVTGDGAAPASTAFDGNIGSTGIGIGIEGDGVGSSLFGTIKNVRIGVIKPTDAQLQAMTA